MKNNVSFNSELSKFGIGLFETIKVEEGPLDLDLHMNRMFKSIESLNMNIKYHKEFLTHAILNYIDDNKIKNKALRITVFDEGYNISTRPITYDEETYNKGFKLTISPIKRGDSIIYKHKTTNYYENIYTKKYANENNFDDGLFVNYENIILECSMSNIFFIKEDKIYTPHDELPILNGIMKRKILDICKKLNIEVIEGEIKLADIKNFNFAFISNSLMKTMKISQIDEIAYPSNNEVFKQIISYI
ncbi:aminotransferase class IV [Terrisporobacter mayombei]|uniref:Aminodeoxychorismate lyase n=1 Tax=Terrisporobacter mayombei TaxID=1541 RepID=A0ABY9PY90_9FIRM|nr:aminotransferase class IV [Terrisporobacter mayombei]MCC3868184.1 aminotransferase class IV [Terrisporobacter mayombei]WMT80324.1 Aminodeoxychorismate lyase [Terrisporobacter mayombei]